MKTIFLLLCGVLYVIGAVFFGWNYHETSVYVCLYWWPYICAVSTLPILLGLVLRIIKNKKHTLSMYALPCFASYSWLMFDIARHFIRHYEVCYNNNIDRMFYGCQNELKEIARLCSTDYATVNLSIYVVLFLIIMSLNTVCTLLAFPSLRSSKPKITSLCSTAQNQEC